MHIKLYFFGKKNEQTTTEQELVRRIGFRCKIEIIPIAQAGIKDSQKAKTKESEIFLNKITKKDIIIAFDEHGKEYNSIDFSKWIKNNLIEHSTISFVIGGAHGLDETILKRANYKIRLGSMVWTRNLFRHMALEQIYRALEIDGGSNFHKE